MHLFYHAKYSDVFTPMLFHLANGHDYRCYLDKCCEEDHQMASRQEGTYCFRKPATPKGKAAAGAKKAPDIPPAVMAELVKRVAALEAEDVSASDRAVPSLVKKAQALEAEHISQSDPDMYGVRCTAAMCRCQESLEKWTVKLRCAMNTWMLNWTPAAIQESFTKAVNGVIESHASIGITVTLGSARIPPNDTPVPVSKPAQPSPGRPLIS